MARPLILRFDRDDFMDEFLALMRYQPQKLSDWRARPETWRRPMAKPSAAAKLQPTEPLSKVTEKLHKAVERRSPSSIDPVAGAQDEALKLYQPVHQRFYLVSAALVCDRPGLPHRQVDASANERAAFVMRRIESPSGAEEPATEYAFVQTADGFQWQEIATDARQQLVTAEERMGLFNVDFTDSEGRSRRLFAGLVPVSRREAYHAAPVITADGAPIASTGGGARLDPRKALFMSSVVAPWKALLEQAFRTRDSMQQAFEDVGVASSDSDREQQKHDEFAQTQLSRNQIQTGSWFVLLDLAKYLREYLPTVWSTVRGVTQRVELSNQEQAVFDWLDSAPVLESSFGAGKSQVDDLVDTSVYESGDIRLSLIDALVSILPAFESDQSPENRLEKVEGLYDRTDLASRDLWPEFIFPLAEPAFHFGIPLNEEEDYGREVLESDGFVYGAVPDPSTSGIDIDDDILVDLSDPLDVRLAMLDTLANQVGRALGGAESELPEIPLTQQTAVALEDYRFVIRCVYERPNCGPLQTEVLSEPTEPFQMASYFDPEAPGRPLRIPMPLDISPAGLRKFNRNAGFVVSDMFCGQLKRMRGYSLGDLVLSVLPWPFHKDLPDPGSSGSCSKGGGTRFGMICSLSIPIVTICAFVLLIIMVTLFDIFFRWIPYLFTCLPIPGLKAKKT